MDHQVSSSQNVMHARSAALIVIACGVVIVGLVYGAGFLVPIVIAILVVTIIEEIIERLEKLGVPTPVALAAAIVLIVSALAAAVFIIINQLDDFVASWPTYLERVQALSRSLMSGLGERVVSKLQSEAEGLNFTSHLSSALGSAGALLLNIALVVLYVSFLLVERGAISKRIVELGKTDELRERYRNALDSISDGIRGFLFVTTVLSLATAVFSYFVLRALGLDYAEIWALIIFLFNFIPSIGSVIGVLFPALLALVQFDSPTPALIILVGLGLIQFLFGNVVQPMLMGRSFNLSPFVVVVALTFWSAVWGIAGAFLAVPVTAGLVILCREIPQLRWISELLSNSSTGRQPNAQDGAR